MGIRPEDKLKLRQLQNFAFATSLSGIILTAMAVVFFVYACYSGLLQTAHKTFLLYTYAGISAGIGLGVSFALAGLLIWRAFKILHKYL